MGHPTRSRNLRSASKSRFAQFQGRMEVGVRPISRAVVGPSLETWVCNGCSGALPSCVSTSPAQSLAFSQGAGSVRSTTSANMETRLLSGVLSVLNSRPPSASREDTRTTSSTGRSYTPMSKHFVSRFPKARRRDHSLGTCLRAARRAAGLFLSRFAQISISLPWSVATVHVFTCKHALRPVHTPRQRQGEWRELLSGQEAWPDT
jgi:hypothetical protein